MNTILIGNIISLAGCVIMVCIGLIKEKKKILSVQCVQFALMGVGNFVLGGINGTVANIVSILRNIAFYKWRISVPLKLLFIALQVALSLKALSGGTVELLPIIAAALFTWFLDVKSEVRLKIVILITQVMWLIYDFCHLNYVSVSFDALTMVSTTVGIYLILRDHKTKQK